MTKGDAASAAPAKKMIAKIEAKAWIDIMAICPNFGVFLVVNMRRSIYRPILGSFWCCPLLQEWLGWCFIQTHLKRNNEKCG